MKRPWKISLIMLVFSLLTGLVFVLAKPQTATAANPTTMSFQGKVVNANGTNVTDGIYSFVFKLYSVSSGGSAMWTETQSSVTVTSGVFQVSLGSVCPLFVANACNGSTPVDFNTNPNLYLGITFNSDPAGEMSPRVQLQSVPYAFNSDKVGGLSVSQLVQISPGSQQTGFINVSGTINGATLSGTAINNLNVSGTAISGTGALSVAAGGTGQNITINGTTTGKVQIGATSTGDIEFGGGTGGSGCTITNSNGNLACDGTINGALLSSSAVNNLNVSGTAISGTGALSVTAGGTAQNLVLNGTTTGKVQIANTSTGDVEIGGGAASTGCTVTNSTGDLGCSGDVSASGGSLNSGSTSVAGSLVLNDGTVNARSVTLTAPALTSSYSLTLPTSGPAISQCLQTDSATASQLVFGDCAAIAQKLMQTYNTYAINQAATATTAMNYLLPTTATAFSIALGGTTEFKAAAAGSFRACSLLNSAIVTAGSVSVHFRKNGADVSANNYCTLSTTNTRSNSQNIASGVETFAAGDTIGIALVSSGLAPTTLEHWATFTIEYGSGGNGPTSLQDAYNNGGSIISQDATDLDFNLANTATDANFLIDIATGSTGRFAVQNNGTDVLTANTSGLTNTGTYNGNTFSSSTLSFSGASANSINGTNGQSLTVQSQGSGQLILNSASGTLGIGSGTTTIQRTAASDFTLDLNDASTRTFTLKNTGSGIANLNLFGGSLQTGSTPVTRLDNAGNLVNIGTIAASGLATLSGGFAASQAAGSSATIAATGVTRTADILTISNSAGQEPTADGINAIQLTWLAKPSTGNTSSAQRINVTNANTVTAGQVQGLRIAATGAGTTINSDTVGISIDALTNSSSGTANENAIEIGTGWDKIIQSANFNVSQAGAITAVSVTGSGALAVASGGTAQNLTLNGSTSGLVQIGATSTGNIELGGGSGSTGCTITNSSGALACTAGFTGTSLTGVTALAVASGGTAQNLTLNGSTSGLVQIGATSTGNIELGGGSAATGCTVTNSTGALACSSTINGITGFAFNGTAGLTRTCTNAGNITSQGGIITANTCTTSDIRLKNNIAALEDNVLDKIKTVNVVSYDYNCYADFFTTFQNTCPADQQSGVIAQQLAEIFPNIVHQYGSENGGYYWVDYDALSIYTLKAVTQIAQHIDSTGNANFKTIQASDSIVTSKLVSDGALGILSGKDEDVTIDSSAVGMSQINIGTEAAAGVTISKAGATTAIKGALVAEGPTDFNGDVSMNFTSPEVGFKINNNGSAQPIENAIDIKDSGNGYGKLINSSKFSVGGNGDVLTNGNVIAKGGTMQILSADGQQLISFDQTGSAYFKGNLNLASASLSGGLTVAGDLNIAGLSSFQKLATFFAKTIFKQDVDFQGHLNVSKDSAGYAQFKTGEVKVHVDFAVPYAQPPVVNANTTDGQFVSSSISNISVNGFDIVLKDPASADLKMSWTAVGVIDPVIASNPHP